MHLHLGWMAVVHGKGVEKSWRALTWFTPLERTMWTALMMVELRAGEVDIVHLVLKWTSAEGSANAPF